MNIPQAGGGFFQRNLEDGIHPKVDVIGAEFKYDLGNNFTVLNKTRYTNINMNYTGIFLQEDRNLLLILLKIKALARTTISIL